MLSTPPKNKLRSSKEKSSFKIAVPKYKLTTSLSTVFISKAQVHETLDKIIAKIRNKRLAYVSTSK